MHKYKVNTALIISPYDSDFAQAIITAARIVENNIKKKRADPEKEVVLLASELYRDHVGPKPALARIEIQFLQKHATSIITREVPGLIPPLRHLTTTVDMETRAFDFIQIDQSSTKSQTRASYAKRSGFTVFYTPFHNPKYDKI